jgi:hypothetical protein
VKERSLEFGGEGVRKFDLIRWNLLGQRLTEAKADLTAMSKRSGTFAGIYANNLLDFSQLPDSVVYSKASTTPTGLILRNSLYVPRNGLRPASGDSMVLWVSKSVANVLTSSGASNGYAFYFKANHSELLPIPQPALDANYNLKQDYGY